MALCPNCKKKGLEVEKIVVINHSKETAWPIDDAKWFLCEQPGCDVIYFTKDAKRVLKKQDVKTRVTFKETTSPRPPCYCKMVTEEDVIKAIENGAKTLAEVRKATGIGGGGHCELTNPGGACCSRNYVPFILGKLKASNNKAKNKAVATKPLFTFHKEMKTGIPLAQKSLFSMIIMTKYLRMSN